MKKVLVIITTGVVEYGGLFTVMKNYLYNMDRTGLSISILSCNKISDNIKEEFRDRNITYHQLYSRKRNPIRYCAELYRLLIKERFEIIHVNGNSSTMMLELFMGKIAGVETRIAHCHTSNSNYFLVNEILSLAFNKLYTRGLAVSKASGDWVYKNNKYTVLKNAIKVLKFQYNQQVRIRYRQELGLEGKIVLGTIGKLNKAKNHIFLLDILKKLLEIDNRYILLLIGEGSERKRLQDYAIKLNISEQVIMLGARTDNAELLQAMDIFLFPSYYEGFGLAFVEAQASGLPCICSNGIPLEAQICKKVKNLELDLNKWIKHILSIAKEIKSDYRKIDSEEALKKITKEGLNIEYEASKLRSIYDGLL